MLKRVSCGAVLGAGLVMIAGAIAAETHAPPPIANPHLAPAPVAALPGGTVIARFDGGTVTAADLDAAVAEVRGPERLEYRTAEPLRELVDALVDRQLMARAARAARLDQDAEVKMRLSAVPGDAKLQADMLLAEAWLEREIARSPPVTDQDIARSYRARAAEFTVPARVRVTRVVAATEAAAGRLRDRLARGASAAALREIDPGHVVSVDEVWIQDRPKRGDMEQIVFGLKAGASSDVFRVAAGFAAVRVEQIAAPRQRPLSEVRQGIRAGLEDERRRKVAAERRAALRKGTTVTIDDAAFAAYVQAAAAAN
jgi:parvulin-like peptidyl-prolyl isomerase